MRNDGFSIEERDDKRTLDGSLVPDCEKVPFGEETAPLPVLEYLGEFKALIDACGQVSYYFNMKKFVAAGVNKAKNIASAYHHDLRYYSDQLNEWKEKARRSFAILGLHASKFGYEMPNSTKKEINNYLNGLVVSKDRRDAYKDYLDTCLDNNKTLSPKQLEAKFQQRLQKRLKKAMK